MGVGVGKWAAAKVDANAVAGISGMLTWAWASLAPTRSSGASPSPSVGSSFVRIADRFFKRGAMSSGTALSTAVVSESSRDVDP